ncbi:hypothetical protein JVU11DRAFT_12611 [Chiua virens]|nr:hypothetical protein JVU11DRAFT_12611 [Chiua virens]
MLGHAADRRKLGKRELDADNGGPVSQLIQVPEPKRIDIRLSPASIFAPVRSGPTVFVQPTFAGTFSAAVARAPITDKAHEMDTSSQTVSQLTSHSGKDPITHFASGSIFIPSDNTAHHVLVTSLTLQAEFMRVVAPNVDTRVYYTCEVNNTGDYILLPGTVKAYLNDKHVSSIGIHTTGLPQILECPLAVDTAVKTIHNRAPEALPSVTEFTGKATRMYTSVTVIHNTHAEMIRGVVVRSAVPLPADLRITIMLKEPTGLANIDEGSVTVKNGCLARWSTKGGRKGKEAGLFEWVCDVDGETVITVKAVWEVCAPRDFELYEQVQL